MKASFLQGGEGLAEAVKERCLQDLRDRLALRANLLQDKLDEVSADESTPDAHRYKSSITAGMPRNV